MVEQLIDWWNAFIHSCTYPVINGFIEYIMRLIILLSHYLFSFSFSFFSSFWLIWNKTKAKQINQQLCQCQYCHNYCLRWFFVHVFSPALIKPVSVVCLPHVILVSVLYWIQPEVTLCGWQGVKTQLLTCGWCVPVCLSNMDTVPCLWTWSLSAMPVVSGLSDISDTVLVGRTSASLVSHLLYQLFHCLLFCFFILGGCLW